MRCLRAERPSFRAWVSTLSFLAACEPPPREDPFEPLPIEYTTEKLNIATSFLSDLCPSDLERLDAHVRRVESVLGTEGVRTLYIHDIDTWPVPGCREGAFGCFHPNHDVAIALPFAINHELVHAVSIDLGLPPAFWNEGLAEALSDRAIAYEPADLASLLDLHPRDFGYSIPDHFVR